MQQPLRGVPSAYGQALRTPLRLSSGHGRGCADPSLVGSSYARADVIYGTDASESIDGGPGQDTIWAKGGWDYIDGHDGNDDLHAGDGDDSGHGGAGRDDTFGGDDDDDLWGGDGDDEFYDSQVESFTGDTFYGNDGNDYIDMLDGDGNDNGFGGPDTDDWVKDSGDAWSQS